jgi:hypothetical protein
MCGANMPALRYIGPGGEVPSRLNSLGWTLVEHAKAADAMVIETYDNQDQDYRKRLEGTITLVRSALDEIAVSQVKTLIIVTDQSSTTGERRKGVDTTHLHGACPDGIHGFGSLTAETLGRIAAQQGVNTRILRLHNLGDDDRIQLLEQGLKKNTTNSIYEVMTFSA